MTVPISDIEVENEYAVEARLDIALVVGRAIGLRLHLKSNAAASQSRANAIEARTAPC